MPLFTDRYALLIGLGADRSNTATDAIGLVDTDRELCACLRKQSGRSMRGNPRLADDESEKTQ